MDSREAPHVVREVWVSLDGTVDQVQQANGDETSNEPKTTAGEFVRIIKFINFFGYSCGIAVDEDWQFNYRVMGIWLSNSCFYWLQSYSIFVVFPSVAAVILFAGVFFVFGCSVKLGVIWFNHKKFYSLMDFCRKVFKENPSGKRRQIMLTVSETVFNHFKRTAMGFCLSLFVYLSYPLYDLVVNGNLTKVSPLIIPSVDDQTVFGYIVSMFMNTVPVIWDFLGYYTVDCIFLTYVGVLEGLVSVVEDDLEIFDDMWQTKNSSIISQRKSRFRNIMMEITDLARFSSYMRELFSFIATVQVFGSAFGIAFVLFGILKENYFGGYGAVFFFLVQIVTFCYMGQLFQNTTERLAAVIYNSKWYLYDKKCQLDIMFALNVIQNVQPVVIADIEPLNLETCLLIMNRIYSLVMFMINTFL